MVNFGLRLPLLIAGSAVAAGGAAVQGSSSRYDSAAALDRALRNVHAALVRGTDLYEDHSSWDKAWRVDSDHYSVKTVDSYFLAKDLAAGLDVMLGHFRETLALEETPAARANVFVVPDINVYNQLGASYDQHSSFYGSFFADKNPERPVIAVFAPPNPTLLRMQITHSALHQFLNGAFPGRTPPTWIDEGLASYFAIYWDYDWGLSEFERMRKERSLLPLRQLLGDDIAAYATQPHVHMMELGLLFYYLLRYRDDTRTTQPDEAEARSPFRDYLLATLRGRETANLPVSRLFADLDALDRDFLAYEFPR